MVNDIKESVLVFRETSTMTADMLQFIIGKIPVRKVTCILGQLVVRLLQLAEP